MSKACLVKLPEDGAAPLHWQIMEDAIVTAQGTASTQEDLPKLADMPIAAIVPGDLVSMHPVRLPAISGKKARMAAGFALEDALAVPIDDVHIAMGGQDGADGPTGVAVLSSQQMDQWMDRLDRLGLSADKMIPDYGLLPARAGHLVVTASGDKDGQVMARLGHSWAGAGEPALMATVLEQLLADHSDYKVESIGPLPLAVRDVLSASGCDVAENNMPAAWSARAFDPEVGPNLLQGAFAKGTAFLPKIMPWRLVVGLAVCLAMVAMAGQMLEKQRLHRQAQQLEQAAEDVFRQALPDVQRIVNMRAQMRQQLVRQGNSADPFLTLQSALFTALEDNANMRIESLRFDGDQGRLQVQLVFANFEDMQVLKNALARSPIMLSEGASRQVGGQIFGELVLEMQR